MKLIGMHGEAVQVDHIVVINPINREVWNCVDNKSMKLLDGVFDACVAGDAEFLRIDDLKKMHMQEFGKKAKEPNR